MDVSLTAAEEERYAELQSMALDAAREGNSALLRQMVQHGLPVNLADHKGNTLLMLAAYNGQAETVHALLELGAEVDRRNDRGQTPLSGVAFKGDVASAKILLAAGANPHAPMAMGMTPYRFACVFGRTEIVHLFNDREGSLPFKGVNRLLVRVFSALGLSQMASLVRRKHVREVTAPVI